MSESEKPAEKQTPEYLHRQLLHAVSNGDLKAALEIREALGDRFTHAAYFAESVREAVETCMILPGMTPEEVIEVATKLDPETDFFANMQFYPSK